jgi:hypothetical protein
MRAAPKFKQWVIIDIRVNDCVQFELHCETLNGKIFDQFKFSKNRKMYCFVFPSRKTRDAFGQWSRKMINAVNTA